MDIFKMAEENIRKSACITNLPNEATIGMQPPKKATGYVCIKPEGVNPIMIYKNILISIYLEWSYW